MGPRAVGLAEDASLGVEIAPAVEVTEVAPTRAGKGPNADRMRRPVEGLPTAKNTAPAVARPASLAPSLLPVTIRQRLETRVVVTHRMGSFRLVAALGAKAGAAPPKPAGLLPRPGPRRLRKATSTAPATCAGPVAAASPVRPRAANPTREAIHRLPFRP